MTKHPRGNTNVNLGKDVTVSVSATGPEPLSYKWKKDGEELLSDTKYTGANTHTLTISSFSKGDRGNYMCTVSCGQQSVESKPAALELGMSCLFSSFMTLAFACVCSRVYTDLQIMKQPQSSISCKYHTNAVLSVSAVGYGPLSYVWKKDGKDISCPECTGINTDTLTISYFSHKHQGTYWCIVSDSQKTAKSEPANLTLGLC